jgi:hypothetical protein
MSFANCFRDETVSVAILTQIPSVLQSRKADENEGEPQQKRYD